MARLKQVTTEQIISLAKEHEFHLLAGDGIHLEPVPFQNPYIQMLWREHYVGSKGTVGRQLHYIVYYDGKAVGGISAGSAMFANRHRDKFLNVSDQEKKTGLRNIVNNTMFRMKRPPNELPLATDVLKVFKTTIIKEWFRRYGDHVRAFETLVEPPRWGGIYKLDGWTKIGKTAGLGARRPEGHGTAGKASTGVRKIVKVPIKIIWVLPICSFEKALTKSQGKNSFGDDHNLLKEFGVKNIGKEISLDQIIQETGVSHYRLKVILYNMREKHNSVEQLDSNTIKFTHNLCHETNL